MNVSVDIEVICDCGARLEAEVGYRQQEATMCVKPCETCMDERYEEGRAVGIDEGSDNP